MSRGFINPRRDDPYKDYDWDNDGYPGEFVYGDDYFTPEEYMDEVWKRVRGYDAYWVSNMGRVYSTYKRKFLKQTATKKGHLYVDLHQNGVERRYYVHRLVADAFIPNPNNLPHVRHGDDIPDYNEVENLSWGYPKDNVHDCIRLGNFYRLNDEDRELAMQKRRTPIVAVNLRTGIEIEYISQQEAARQLGINQSTINEVLNGYIKHAYGYYFYYANDPKTIDVVNYKYSRHNAWIKATDLYTGEAYIFKGQTEAARKLNMSVASVSMVLSGRQKQAKGYTFEYLDEEEWPDE